MSNHLSNRKIKKLRKQGKIINPKVGHGHVVYSGYGTHKDKRLKSINKIVKEDLQIW